MKIKSKLTHILFALLAVILFTVFVSAATYGDLTYSVSNGEVTITDCKESASGALTIPDQISGYPVTSIGASAFRSCSKLTSITIPSSVTSIGGYAFSGCSSLTSITIPSSVTSIGNCAFYGCSSLTNITIPSSVTSIGSSAFKGCSSITSITIPSSVMSIGGGAFQDCSNLASIAIPSSVSSIGGFTFSGCSKLTSIEIPSSVTYIGERAFDNCAGLKNTIGKLSYIQTKDNPYFYLSKWTGGNTITSLSTSIDENCKFIGSNAFYDCSKLKSIEIPASVIGIGDYAFSGCSSLTNIEISSSVQSIASSAFQLCSGLVSIMVSPENPYYSSDAQGCLYNKEKTELCCCPGGKPDYVFPFSVTNIGDFAFAGCGSLTSIEIPSSVAGIGDEAFFCCSSLTSIEIPSSVTTIGSSAFWKCTNLVSVTIPSSVTSIGTSAFRDCSSLTSITIPSAVTTIEGFTFWNCSSLSGIQIPASVMWIRTNAFDGCSSLMNITIWNSNCNVYNSDDIPQSAVIYGYPGSTAQTYANKFSRTFVALPLPENPLSLSGVYTNGEGDLRFVTRVTSTAGDPEIEYFGTYIVPLSYFTAHELNAGGGEQPGVAAVKYTQSIENGASFAADLTDIPGTYFDIPIFAWSFVKFQGIDAVYTQVLGSFTVSGARLVKGGF